MDQTDLMDNGAPPEESGNRTFVIVAAVLGGIVLLTLACLAIYVLVIMPGQREQAAQAQATVAAQNTVVAQGLTQTAVASLPTSTRPPSPTPTHTPTASPTPLIALPTSTPLVGGGLDPATATFQAQLTQVAANLLTVVPTSTALPATGFADEVGAPGLLLIGFVLIAVILLARRLRRAGAAAG